MALAADNGFLPMLTPVILTLTISEDEKNNPDVIATIQDRVLESLRDFQVENITRYRYIPSLAISVDEAGLDSLKKSNDIKKISNDGLSAPHVNKSEDKSPLQKHLPCNKGIDKKK